MAWKISRYPDNWEVSAGMGALPGPPPESCLGERREVLMQSASFILLALFLETKGSVKGSFRTLAHSACK